jgi:hypothetical protein
LSGIAPYKIHDTARYLLPCSAPAPPAHLPTAALLLVRHHCARTRTSRLHLHPRPSLRAPPSACLPAPAHPAALGCPPLHALRLHRHPPTLLPGPICPARLSRPSQPPPTCTLFLWCQPAAQSLIGSEYPAGPVLQGVELVCEFPGHGNAHVPRRFHLLRQAPLLLRSRSPHCSTLPLVAVPPLHLHLLLISVRLRSSRSLVSIVHRSLKPPSHPRATHSSWPRCFCSDVSVRVFPLIGRIPCTLHVPT